MTQFVLYTGIAIFGLICLIRPQYFVNRKNKKDKSNQEQSEETRAKDIRFFRIFGAVLVCLYLVGFLINLILKYI